MIQWLITPLTTDKSLAFHINNFGAIGTAYNITTEYAIRPVVYLKSNIRLADGDGTSINPYSIK